jgi:hypothetical protein
MQNNNTAYEDLDDMADSLDTDSVDELTQCEVIPFEEPTEDSSKTGPKPKRLVAVEVQGYEVGRGLRKRVVIPNDVYRLAQFGSTDREIARWFDIDENTLRYNFSDILEKARTELKHSLRRAQIKLALSGNAVMLIWLGKNLLGQTDTPTDTDNNKPLPWTED